MVVMKEKFNVLDFIDSKDIREFNRETQFTPAEQAVLISCSKMRTVDEKLSALQYIVDTYTEDEFGDETVTAEDCFESDRPFREVVRETIRIWTEAINDRYNDTGYIYAAVFCERECVRDGFGEYKFFSSYDRAYEMLKNEKEEYLQDSKLNDIQTYGEIVRIRIDDPGHDRDIYKFDNELRLVVIFSARSRQKPDIDGLADEYSLYIPLPFEPGDIVKCVSPFYEVYFGVFSRKWEKPAHSNLFSMMTSLDVYIKEDDDFDFTDDTWILDMEFSSKEELPEKEKALILISEVRKNRLDFYSVLHLYGRKELESLIQAIK